MLEQVHLAYTGYLLLELRACRAGIYDQDESMLRMKEEEEQMGTSVLPPDACVWGKGKNGYLLMLACGEAAVGTAPTPLEPAPQTKECNGPRTRKSVS